MFYLIFSGVAVMKNKLFAIGGYNGSDRLDTVEVFDAETKRWSRVVCTNFTKKLKNPTKFCFHGIFYY